jgi:uncharacterized protein involved in type VI secretion and phage assembly
VAATRTEGGGSVAATDDGLPLMGVAIAVVADNKDLTGQGRVKLRLPWLPDVEPWARVATAAAGGRWGTYFIPQVGDEVVVGFQHGDVREPFVLGSVWSLKSPPPAKTLADPIIRRAVVTPAGHEIELHDLKQSVTVKTATGQTVTLTPEKIEVTTAGGTATVVLETAGSVSVTAAAKIELKAPSITLDAATVEVKASATAKLTAGAVCEIKGGLVKIN